MAIEIKKHECPVCGKPTDSEVCNVCEDLGWWVDPTGGTHQDNPENEFIDPAKMYE